MFYAVCEAYEYEMHIFSFSYLKSEHISDGRPNSQLVSKKWQTNWGLYMAARKGVIYITMDVRGAKGQSSPDLYRLLGDVEVKDQLDVIRLVLYV